MTKVFVGNFAFSVDDDQLREYFAEVGNVVSAKVMTEGEGGRSRGFGFVEFSSEEEARKAIAELDGKTWNGRQIKVSEDRGRRRSPRPEGGRPGADRGGNSGLPTGFFRAQPFSVGVKRRKRLDPFMEDTTLQIDYKDPKLLRRFMSERGKVLPRRMTNLTSQHQRQIAKAIKRAQHLALLPIKAD